MKTLEEIFYKEFNQMLSQRKAQSGVINLYDIPIPESVARNKIDTNERVYINGITDEYYSKLNGTEAILLSRPSLKRRKFDHNAKFIEKDGKPVLEDVDVHSGCVAIVSKEKLGVPLKYKPNDTFEYVDVICKKTSEGNDVRYIYTIPKKYCYKLNMVALVISLSKMRVYYDGISMALQDGNIIYLYTIPYKPSKAEHSYRCLGTKTSLDFNEDIDALRDYWLEHNMLFNYEKCELYEGVKGRSNVAYEQFPQVLDTYMRYDPNKSLAENKQEVSDEVFN